MVVFRCHCSHIVLALLLYCSCIDFVVVISRFPSEQRERLQAAIDNPDSLRIVVDLDLAESTSGKEVSSLVKQLCYVYNRVKASPAPPTLTLTSYQGRVATALSK